MNAAVLLIPLFLIRYGLPAFVNKSALPRAAHFPPMQGREKLMFFIYQLSSVFILVYMFFLKAAIDSAVSKAGVCVYIAGTLLFAVSTLSFSKSDGGVNKDGMYRISRNPMYIAYFVYFLSCGLITQAPLLLAMVCVFQISSHWVILAEERWCIRTFGDEYRQYMNTVRRYI